VRLRTLRTVRLRTLLEQPAALVLQGAALVALLGSASAWSMTARTVTVSVDGASRAVTTHGGTVAEVLSAAHVSVGAHDLLAPARETSVEDGGRVVLRHGRQLQLTVDGSRRTVWVTAASVAGALDQLGLPSGGARLSADRSREIPLNGFALDVRTLKAVSVLYLGRRLPVSTTGLTVGDALRDAKLAVAPSDALRPPAAGTLHDGEAITVTRVEGRTAVEPADVPFGTEQQSDPGSYTGTTRVLFPGQVGVLERTYALTYTDQRLTAKRLVSEAQTVAPRNRIIGVGSLDLPVPAPVPAATASAAAQPAPAAAAPAAAPTAAASSSGTSSGGLNWDALANCESGGNPRAVSPGGDYRGLYQFSIGTWQGVGGSGDPIDASPGEQTNRASILYSRTGRSSWPVCGKYL